ncbi:isoprenoid synthase domain-containing protein [Hygrophoropsis aurantiaca]|uniref:Isoprenoid synthase domain-containing protein n=1 Tax=Hygrophoropsis aurantiaca TaxID=72124 RepID=A0ACB7ZZG3_9AGAM|nr:isoprenoid synthase domain-containing protein [Hygrophoropsis aurantiaca]
MSSRFYQLPDLLTVCPQKRGSTNVHAQVADVQRHQNCGKKCLILGDRDRNKDCKSAQAVIAISYVCLSEDAKVFEGAVAWGMAGFILEKVTDNVTVEDARKWASLYTTAFDYSIGGINDKRPLAILIKWIKTLHPFVKLIRRRARILYPRSFNGNLRILYSLAVTMNECLEDHHRKDFVDANSIFAQSMVQEAVDRQSVKESDAKPTMDAYLVARKDSIGVKPALVLARSAVGLKVGDKLLDEPPVKGMEDATADLITIANDLYSYKKELAEENGAPHNLLTVLMQQDPQLDLQGAIDCVGQLFESTLARFKACRTSLPLVDKETDKMLAVYADMMVDMFAGNVEWSLVTPRYRLFDCEEHRQKGIMVL